MAGRIGIIGGSGLYDLEGLESGEQLHLHTPFGPPSDLFQTGILSGQEIVFLPRHGKGHVVSPSNINYRANIWGMKKLGVDKLISVSAVGSLREEIKPLDIVLVDQFVNRTYKRKDTFFHKGMVSHIMFDHPVCLQLQQMLRKAAAETSLKTRVHMGGTYVNIEGPAFSTRAESNLYRNWGMDVVGMTNMTEARLAREAELCYATLALVTDYDCWKDDDQVNVEMVIKNLCKCVSNAKDIIVKCIGMIDETVTCECNSALENPSMTDPELVPETMKKKISLLIEKYIEQE